jgi:hypothetical protein
VVVPAVIAAGADNPFNQKASEFLVNSEAFLGNRQMWMDKQRVDYNIFNQNFVLMIKLLPGQE